jgi:hypothetical protein
VFFQLFIMHSGSCNIVGGEQFSSAAFVVTFSVLDIGIVGNSMIVFKHYQIARSPWRYGGKYNKMIENTNMINILEASVF